jgi:predicted transcriptional regulator
METAKEEVQRILRDVDEGRVVSQEEVERRMERRTEK